MKRISKFLIIAVWAVLICILFRLNLLTGDMDNLKQFFNSCGSYKVLIFIALSSLRIVALIPSAVFMILGGVIFDPFEGVLLTLISVVLSETIVYLTSKILVSSGIQNLLVNKYPKLYELLLKNNTKILAIGILCPIAPSDVACFLASSTGLTYRNFILTVVIGNMPMMILYGFLGNSFLSSGNNTIMIAGIIILISIYSIYLWSKEQRVQKLG
jgi:uncharacterized membrane protein YdjX (TVP38/TMEM64 family)